MAKKTNKTSHVLNLITGSQPPVASSGETQPSSSASGETQQEGSAAEEPVSAPSVAFVQQQVCRLPIQAAPVLRFLDDLSHIRHAAGYGVKLHKSGMRRIGDDGGERRFAAAVSIPHILGFS